MGFIAFLLLSIFFPSVVQAENTSTEEKMGFTVESIIPDNQVDTTKTYFYLAMKPNQKQSIQVKLKSLQDTPLTIQVGIHTAVSSSVGAIDYTNVHPKFDASMKDPISELVKIKDGVKEIPLKGKEEKTITFEITTPESAFSGVKLGSLRFVRKNSTEVKQKKSGLTPQYARVIAIMLTEDEEPFNQGAMLHLKKASLQLANGQKVIAARIQNDQPKVLQELTIQGEIRLKGEKKILYKHKMEKFSVAPNSNFDFNIPIGLNTFKPGTYHFTGKATGDGRTWKWEKEFKVGEAQAKK